MKESAYKNYDELPLFLNVATVAKVLGVSPSSGYELMHETDFPVLKIGNRMECPKRNSWSGCCGTFREAQIEVRTVAQA